MENQKSLDHINMFRITYTIKISKILKGIVTLGLVASIALSATSCNLIAELPDNGSVIVDGNQIDINKNPTDQTQNPDNNQAENPDNNQNHNQNQGNQNQDNTIDLSEYSDLMKNVLTKEYYLNTLKTAHPDSQYFESNPYGFLRDEGFDNSKILDETYQCYSRSFILDEEPNSLYVLTRVEDQGRYNKEPFFHQYVLKYTLTDQEVEDYIYAHHNATKQAPFFTQELSYMKTPEVLSETKITVKAHNKLFESLSTSTPGISDYVNGDKMNYIALKSFDVENGTFEVIIFGYAPFRDVMFKHDMPINIITLTNGLWKVSTNSDGAFYGPHRYTDYLVAENNSTEYKSSITFDPTVKVTSPDLLKVITGDLSTD